LRYGGVSGAGSDNEMGGIDIAGHGRIVLIRPRGAFQAALRNDTEYTSVSRNLAYTIS
jgi:hypothetical protein